MFDWNYQRSLMPRGSGWPLHYKIHHRDTPLPILWATMQHLIFELQEWTWIQIKTHSQFKIAGVDWFTIWTLANDPWSNPFEESGDHKPPSRLSGGWQHPMKKSTHTTIWLSVDHQSVWRVQNRLRTTTNYFPMSTIIAFIKAFTHWQHRSDFTTTILCLTGNTSAHHHHFSNLTS